MSEERTFPIIGGVHNVGTIPWCVAERAYRVYASKYGDSQSLERLKERGGFHVQEMDEFYPEWENECSQIKVLEKENKKRCGIMNCQADDIIFLEVKLESAEEKAGKLKRVIAGLKALIYDLRPAHKHGCEHFYQGCGLCDQEKAEEVELQRKIEGIVKTK